MFQKQHSSMFEQMSLEDKSQYTISMDIDPNTPSFERKYPSIKDYYQTNVRDREKPIQLQKGLSNYSGLLMGDDRIAFSESILSGTHRVTVEDKMAIPSPSLNKPQAYRRGLYHEAAEKVGDSELNRLERVMKDKLFQRSYMTSSPFQVNKAFKFFDREMKMKIHIEGFTRALEFLGFQFSELQNLALFARYDPDCTGEIDYMNFIAKAMFYGTDYKDNLPVPKNAAMFDKKADDNDEMYHVDDFDGEELKKLQENELKLIFNKISNKKTGELQKDKFDLLLLAAGFKTTPKQLDTYWTQLGLGKDDTLKFESFFEWWRRANL